MTVRASAAVAVTDAGDAAQLLAVGLIVAGVLGVAAWIIIDRARDRRLARLLRQNRCARCGYDRRASPDCCPECGATDEPAGGWVSVPLDLDRLRDDWPTAAVEPAPPEPWQPFVPVHITADPQAASLLTRQFLARGVWCRVSTAAWAGTNGESTCQTSTFEVPASEREVAERIVARFRPAV